MSSYLCKFMAGVCSLVALKEYISYCTLTSTVKSLENSVSSLVWLDGEVKALKNIESISMPDLPPVVYTQYKQITGYNRASERLENHIQKMEKFKLITDKGDVIIYPAGIVIGDMIYTDYQPIKKSTFQWIKTGLAVLASLFFNRWVIQDIYKKTTEEVLMDGHLCSAFGKIIKIGSKYGMISDIIVKNKSELVMKNKARIAVMVVSALLLALVSAFPDIEIRSLKRQEKTTRTGPGMKCLTCKEKFACRLLKPCFHLSVCDTCLHDICPMCLHPVNEYTNIFF
ncbi:hypothetical protein SteCoe_18968 [Stentor coeruleus]|uniref:RING-type domain-containing protein n=1 Tax=Stentor coeruleus TaxID=5963 RepID=A0A1R2BVN5_9CILI|nr:hypothetical protein SteCoe_18968 [Stentor coeruleus]